MAFRGGVLGFFLGVSVAAASGYSYLLSDYNHATGTVVKSVEDLQKSTNKLRDSHLAIDNVAAELKSLRGDAATREELARLRGEVIKAGDSAQSAILALRTELWDLQQDVNLLKAKKQ
ncbi:hypothetical protein M427DRAFT_52205 [Gonapodya prolifera JEL478]|uniref:Uncharacterized protein n=1 Tax=Gonapodya prolifera (strain JEL478) TaxID=1344416 RepID=A0A139AV94_GONPJ|nr:hypothetical protein M427DRAFT_52205 [Gonapodya prolifera JEL478]|eukprot:KXS20619.1 hypothetical protein M427DRAFT_52205 [Gonapodya prolifera JEL478]